MARLALILLIVSMPSCTAVQDDAATGASAMKAGSSSAAIKTALVDFDVTPFPYSGTIPDTGKPFLDVTSGERRGHTAPRGGIVWEDQTYHDRRVLLAIPAGFDASRPAAIVVFFHGNNATLQRDVVGRQQVPRQLAASGLNAVLVAPQFAVDARDSSAGGFWEPEVFARFIDEAASRLTKLNGGGGAAFHSAPVVFVAYSGGYLPAAYSLQYWGGSRRLRGVILLDAAYGELDKFADWVASRRDAFFFSAYSKSTSDGNLRLQQLLAQRGVSFQASPDATLAGGSVTFIETQESVHNDFVTQAWTSYPLLAVLSRIARR
ncbi:MAG: alpha/beta hydrolase [Hyphomicrobiales bacterium]